MKSTGIVRKVDDLGRIVIPVETRRTLDIEEGDTLEIFTSGNNIIFKKYEPACVFCGGSNNTITYKEKVVCKKCLNEIAETA